MNTTLNTLTPPNTAKRPLALVPSNEAPCMTCGGRSTFAIGGGIKYCCEKAELMAYRELHKEILVVLVEDADDRTMAHHDSGAAHVVERIRAVHGR